jgi:hypothetical protein
MISALRPEARLIADIRLPLFSASRAALVAITRMVLASFSCAVLAKSATASAVLAMASSCNRCVS